MFYNNFLSLGGPCLIEEASPSIYIENQWTSFYTIESSVAKELRLLGSNVRGGFSVSQVSRGD